MLSKKKSVIFGIVTALAAIFVLVVMLFGIETALRFKYKAPQKFLYSLNPRVVIGFTTFQRSKPPESRDLQPRIFCIGGSTTHGSFMPWYYSYPSLLQSLIDYNQKTATVYNFGVSGVSAVATNFIIKNILPRYQPKCVVIHDGYNDLPIVVRKKSEDAYLCIFPDYEHPYNPYVGNPVVRYMLALVKFNFEGIRRFVLSQVVPADLFLGYDYKKYKLQEVTPKRVFEENEKRLGIMLEKETDSIDYCLTQGIKVVVILEPYIKPLYFTTPPGTGFRDASVGEILLECHKLQQTAYLNVLVSKYRNNPNVAIVDMREVFKDKYEELFYDECHLNGAGNAVKAQIIYSFLEQLFPEFKVTQIPKKKEIASSPP